MAAEPPSFRLPESIVPKVVWEEVPPEDVLSALRSLPPNIGGEGTFIDEAGRGIDTTLQWAKSELALSEQHTSDEERNSSQAIIHAQCAVECLLDTLLERDWLSEKLPPKAGFSKKVELLSRRTHLQLPVMLLSQFVAEPRHDIIHRYQSRRARDARIVVEAASSIINSIKANSDPHKRKVLAGRLLGGSFTKKAEMYHYFTGFSGSFAITWRNADGVVRAGVGVPSKQDEAEIWWTPLQKFSLEQHFQLLEWWDTISVSTYLDSAELEKRLQLAGLHAL